jgi:fatty acid desaturase (delta-4 desaturase)
VAVGACHAQIGLSIQHDASHGAVSGNSFWNNLLAYGADWIGNSRWVWFQQHVLWHHPHTNHGDLDPDASSAEPFVLFHPEHHQSQPQAAGRRKWFHAFQHWFLHLVLSLYGPSIIWNPVVLLTMQHNEHVPPSVGRSAYMSTQKLHAFALRFFYVARVVIAPWLIGGAALLAAALVPGIVTGVCLTAVFVVSHNFEGSDREPQRGGMVATTTSAEQKKSGGLAVAASKDEGVDVSDSETPICWYKAQAETSCTYGGRIGMLLTGGLNLQIEHHLFPRLSSWYYPVVQDAVRECCARHNVKYAYFPNLWDNMRSMFAYIEETGSHAVKAVKVE